MKNNDQIEVVKADPGWFIAHPSYGEDMETVAGLYLDPVIAWRIEMIKGYARSGELEVITFVFPITLETNDDTYRNCVLKKPDGSFFIPEDQGFESEESVIAYFQNK